jgi:hypothetical protein
MRTSGPAQFDALLALTVQLLHERSKTDPLITLALEHDMGICEPVALCAEAAARQLGIPAKRQSGTVRSHSGKLTAHAWVELRDGSDLIIDSPRHDLLMAATATERGATFWADRA